MGVCCQLRQELQSTTHLNHLSRSAPFPHRTTMRKGAGISALSRHTATTSSYSILSTTLTQTQLVNLQQSLESFRQTLTTFAASHRADIRKDPAFRHQFQKMCAAIGVDPLSGGGRGGGGGGWWTEVLGLGEWQYGLAVQVVDVCVSTRERNGGMIEVTELINRVEKMRGGSGSGSGSGSGVTKEDILRSLDLLKPLHAGYTLLPVGSSLFVRSIPRELDTDQSLLLVLASDTGGRLSEAVVRRMTGWGDVRARTVLDDCVMREGLGWWDDQGAEREIWLIAAVDFGDRNASLSL